MEKRVCRVCLSHEVEENNLTSVFSVCTVPEFDQRTYSDLIMNCTNTQVNKDDNLPKKICNDCATKLFISYNFKTQCEASYNYLLTCKFLLVDPAEVCRNEIKNEDSKEFHGDYEGDNYIGDCQKNEMCEIKMADNEIKREDPKEFNGNCGDVSFIGCDENNRISELVPKVEISILPFDGYDVDYIKRKSRDIKFKEGERKTKLKTKKKINEGFPKVKRPKNKNSTRRLIEGGIKCRFCDMRYHFRSKIEKHERSHFHNKGYYCKICDKNFHSEKFHKAYHSRMGTFECDHCGKVYKNRTGIFNHLKFNHKGERPIFKCDFEGCEKSYNFQSSLASHRVTHGNIRALMCELCSRTYLTRANLKVHMNRVHSDVKKFKCKECDSRYKTSSQLWYHFKSQHLKSKPHQCQLCGASFIHPSRLKRHMVVHTKDYQYKCMFCYKMYSSQDALQSHVKHLHEKKPDGSVVC